MGITEEEIKITQKAMAYDLLRLLDKDKSYTVDEVRTLIDAYISGTQG